MQYVLQESLGGDRPCLLYARLRRALELAALCAKHPSPPPLQPTVQACRVLTTYFLWKSCNIAQWDGQVGKSKRGKMPQMLAREWVGGQAGHAASRVTVESHHHLSCPLAA